MIFIYRELNTLLQMWLFSFLTNAPLLFSAHLHKVKSDASQNTTVKELSEIHNSIPAIFPAAFRSTLELVANNPIHQLFGDSTVILICKIVTCLSGVEQLFLDIFLDVFSVGSNLCSVSDREAIFQRLHQTRLSDSFTIGYMKLLGTLTFSTKTLCHFGQTLWWSWWPT